MFVTAFFLCLSLFVQICKNAICTCVVEGGWSSFGDWSSCSATCGGGIKQRRRTCTNPPPSGGGKCCTGDNLGVKLCKTKPCRGKGE